MRPPPPPPVPVSGDAPPSARTRPAPESAPCTTSFTEPPAPEPAALRHVDRAAGRDRGGTADDQVEGRGGAAGLGVRVREHATARDGEVAGERDRRGRL